MALIKKTEVDKIEVVGTFKHGHVRTVTIVEEDGVEISRSFHRHVVAPGDDVAKEEQTVKDVCGAVHTQELANAYAAHLEATALT